MIKGDLSPLLDYIISDDELRLEVRRIGKCFIYYKKCKILDLGLRSSHINKKYFENRKEPDNIRWKIVNKPEKYFEETKKVIDLWLHNNRKDEFETQQNIAFFNQNNADKYIILDMEYAFEQNQIKKNNREKRGVFDLLGIERETNKIVFFEVKKGMGATKGKSGIDEHINDFKNYLFGKNSDTFRTNLLQDIKNIIEDKTELGILKAFNFSDSCFQQDPELVFVFHPDNDSQIQDFSQELKNRHKLIVVNENNYKLK